MTHVCKTTFIIFCILLTNSCPSKLKENRVSYEYPNQLRPPVMANNPQPNPVYYPRVNPRDETFRRRVYEEIPLVQNMRTQKETMRLLDDFAMKRKKTNFKVISVPNTNQNYHSDNLENMTRVLETGKTISPAFMESILKHQIPFLNHIYKYMQKRERSHIYSNQGVKPSSYAQHKRYDGQQKSFAKIKDLVNKRRLSEAKLSFDKFTPASDMPESIDNEQSNFQTKLHRPKLREKRDVSRNYGDKPMTYQQYNTDANQNYHSDNFHEKYKRYDGQQKSFEKTQNVINKRRLKKKLSFDNVMPANDIPESIDNEQLNFQTKLHRSKLREKRDVSRNNGEKPMTYQQHNTNANRYYDSDNFHEKYKRYDSQQKSSEKTKDLIKKRRLSEKLSFDNLTLASNILKSINKEQLNFQTKIRRSKLKEERDVSRNYEEKPMSNQQHNSDDDQQNTLEKLNSKLNLYRGLLHQLHKIEGKVKNIKKSGTESYTTKTDDPKNKFDHDLRDPLSVEDVVSGESDHLPTGDMPVLQSIRMDQKTEGHSDTDDNDSSSSSLENSKKHSQPEHYVREHKEMTSDIKENEAENQTDSDSTTPKKPSNTVVNDSGNENEHDNDEADYDDAEPEVNGDEATDDIDDNDNGENSTDINDNKDESYEKKKDEIAKLIEDASERIQFLDTEKQLELDEELQNIVKMLDDPQALDITKSKNPEILDILKRETEIMKYLIEQLENQKSTDAFDNVVKKAHDWNRREEAKDATRTTTIATLKTTVFTIEEAVVVQALLGDPYVKRILKLHNETKSAYLKGLS